jgi:lipopolysaccharide export LptBFGC system permease protein LptF
LFVLILPAILLSGCVVGLEIFKNEGLAPDAQQRIARFFKRSRQGT